MIFGSLMIDTGVSLFETIRNRDITLHYCDHLEHYSLTMGSFFP